MQTHIHGDLTSPMTTGVPLEFVSSWNKSKNGSPSMPNFRTVVNTDYALLCLSPIPFHSFYLHSGLPRGNLPLRIHSHNWVFKACSLSNSHRLIKVRINLFRQHYRYSCITSFAGLLFEAFLCFHILAIRSTVCTLNTSVCWVPHPFASVRNRETSWLHEVTRVYLRHCFFMFFTDSHLFSL